MLLAAQHHPPRLKRQVGVVRTSPNVRPLAVMAIWSLCMSDADRYVGIGSIASVWRPVRHFRSTLNSRHLDECLILSIRANKRHLRTANASERKSGTAPRWFITNQG